MIKVKPIKWETHSADQWMNLILAGSFNPNEDYPSEIEDRDMEEYFENRAEVEDHDCHLTPAGDDACDCQSECEHW